MKISFLVLLLSSFIGHATENCPWLNAATAGGILGAPVSVVVEQAKSGNGDADCHFVSQRSSASRQLRIGVRTLASAGTGFAASVAQCGPGPTPLAAIGNEAVMCVPATTTGGIAVKVVGRVRNRIFTILLSASGSTPAERILGDQARNVAEHVAGTLF